MKRIYKNSRFVVRRINRKWQVIDLYPENRYGIDEYEYNPPTSRSDANRLADEYCDDEIHNRWVDEDIQREWWWMQS